MTDQEIIDFLWPNKFPLLKRYLNTKKDITIYIQYLNNRYKDSNSIFESLYRIKYNIENKPLCKKCGKPIQFTLSHGLGKFNNFCSRSCQINQEKIKESIKTKYNVENISQLDFIKEKKKITFLNKYGVQNPFNLESSINKSRKTRKYNKNWIEKQKTTKLKKYNDENYNNKEKAKQTSLLKYGTEYPIQNKLVKDKYNWSEINKKSYLTKKKNHSFKQSKPEDESYILLKEKHPDIKRQYKSKLYPFACDFYIPSLDLYIECNYHWTHGGKIYEGTEEDDKILQQWKDKHTEYYDNAIKTWTYYDVKKNEIARNNNINYKIFWNINELKDWLLK